MLIWSKKKYYKDHKKIFRVFILKKATSFILQNMFWSVDTSSSVVHIKITVKTFDVIRRLLQCYIVVKNTFKNFYLTIFMAINTNIMNKAIKIFYINY